MTFNSQKNEKNHTENPEFAEMVLCLDPETAEILHFLDPEIVKMDKKYLDPENIEMVWFLDPEIVEKVDKSFMDNMNMQAAWRSGMDFHITVRNLGWLQRL